MASRAHVIHDYSYHPSSRSRRQVWLWGDNEPVILPRGRTRGGYGGLLISALIACAATAGAAYAVYASSPPTLAVTPTLPMTPTWTLDTAPIMAQTLPLLRGPALATPSGRALPAEPQESATPAPKTPATSMKTPPASMPAPAASSPEREVTGPDWSKPLTPDIPAKPEAPPSAPYPNPTTTPPELVPENALPAPLPPLDPENPY